MSNLVDIPGYEGQYAITREGKIWSYPKGRRPYGRWLGTYFNKDGYVQINLTTERSDGRKYKSFRVHRLVAEIFIPNPLGLPEVAHLDHNRANPDADNLEWSTHLDNIKQSAKLGHYNNLGVKNPRNFLSESLVLEIRNLYKKGEKQFILAEKYGLKKSHVYGICGNRIWKHLGNINV